MKTICPSIDWENSIKISKYETQFYVTDHVIQQFRKRVEDLPTVDILQRIRSDLIQSVLLLESPRNFYMKVTHPESVYFCAPSGLIYIVRKGGCNIVITLYRKEKCQWYQNLDKKPELTLGQLVLQDNKYDYLNFGKNLSSIAYLDYILYRVRFLVDGDVMHKIENFDLGRLRNMITNSQLNKEDDHVWRLRCFLSDPHREFHLIITERKSVFILGTTDKKAVQSTMTWRDFLRTNARNRKLVQWI